MEGWVKLHRKLLGKPIWLNSTPEQKTILMTLLMLANHQESEWDWGGQKFRVSPGQFVTSLDSIVIKSGKGVSVKNVRTALKRFESLGFLANKVTKHGRIITILNWDTYQLKDEQGGKASGKAAAKLRQTGGETVAPNNNEKNDKNKKKDLAERKKDFASALQQFQNKYGSDMLKNFFDYWTEPNPSGKKMRMEMEKTWDTARRLNRWNKNSYSNNEQRPGQILKSLNENNNKKLINDAGF
ncbi:hypothetical protein SLH46_15225 [Draconibacterium sp. IB214405]|uniref:hypothetical protein n=1 Tax=Draconibacterium sp. IB214405 TaxID=3097352 RepID=UPI002A1818D9|nr:hypothetical protein [Draconibacterium sp. IB214405]MDX8340550.1 hypothetical protein [Draconibacterium sp. IB214405]